MNRAWKFSVVCSDLWMEFDDVDEIQGSKETLSSWLCDDIRGFTRTVDYIDDVLAGKVEEDRLGGDGFSAYVKKEFTEIRYDFEDMDPSVKPCTVPTKLLREIVKAWLEEYERFRASKKK